MNKNSLYSEPAVTPTMKCISCGETLLYAIIDESLRANKIVYTTECRFCGQTVDPEYARRSAMYNTVITRACSWSNTLQTTGNIVMVICGIAFLLGIVVYGRSHFLTALFLSIFYAAPVGLWRYKYGDIEIPDNEFVEAQKKMKNYLHRWLGFIAVEVFVIVILFLRTK